MKIFIYLTLLSLYTLSFAQSPTVTLGGDTIIKNPAGKCTLNIADARNPYSLNTSPSYQVGEFLQLVLTSNCNLHVYLFNIDANDTVNALPNAQGHLVGQGQVSPNMALHLPNPSEGYQLKGTTGEESILALGTIAPLDAQAIGNFAQLIKQAIPFYKSNNGEQSYTFAFAGIQAADWTSTILRYLLSDPSALNMQPVGQPSITQAQPSTPPTNTQVNLQIPNNSTVIISTSGTSTTAVVDAKANEAAVTALQTTPSAQSSVDMSSKQVDVTTPQPQASAAYPLPAGIPSNYVPVVIHAHPRAIVVIDSPVIRAFALSETNVPGDFITYLPPGDYSVRVEKTGRMPRIGNFTVTANQPISVDMILQSNSN